MPNPTGINQYSGGGTGNGSSGNSGVIKSARVGQTISVGNAGVASGLYKVIGKSGSSLRVQGMGRNSAPRTISAKTWPGAKIGR